MQIPLQVSFRGMDRSPAVEEAVRDHTAKLEQYFEHVVACRVMVEVDHHRHHKGNLYHVRIDLSVPGAELVVSRDPGELADHGDVYVAVRDAFDAMGRKLEDHARRIRGQVKRHGSSVSDTVAG